MYTKYYNDDEPERCELCTVVLETFHEGGYYDDMKEEALASLNDEIANVADALSNLMPAKPQKGVK